MTQPPIDPTTPEPTPQPDGIDGVSSAAAEPTPAPGAAETAAETAAEAVPAATSEPTPASAEEAFAVQSGTVLPADGGTPPSSGRRRGLIIGTVVALTVAILGGGAYAAYAFLSGGGGQPEDVVSADALAFVKVDLDPAAGQKVALARLARSLDADADVTAATDDPKRAVASLLSSVTDASVDYDRDIEPWVGDRIAVAVLSGNGSSLEELTKVSQPLVVIATTDEAAAKESLSRLYPSGSQWTVETREGFVLVGSPSATAVPATTLASTNGFIGTKDAVGDSLAFAYINVDRGLDFAESAAGQIEGLLGSSDLTGELSSDATPGDLALEPEFGDSVPQPGQFKEQLDKVRAQLDQIPNRLGTRTVGIGLVAQPDGFDITVRGMGLTKALPTGAPMEVSKNAIGALLIQGYADYVRSTLAELPEGLQTEEAETVLAAFGEQLSAQFGIDGQGTPVVRAVVTGEDTKAIEQGWQTLASSGAVPLEIRNDGQRVVIGTPGASAIFADTEGNARVLATLPDANTAAAFAFIDIEKVKQSPLGGEVDEGLSELSSAGVSVSGPQAGDLTVRLAIRLS